MPWPDRHAGVLLHPTSLPGRFGIGDLGPEAHSFVEWLASAGQSLWQVLPLGPPGLGDSPYSARSAFAGNTLLVSPEKLVTEGLLEPAEIVGGPGNDGGLVDFPAVAAWKDGLLRTAFRRFSRAGAWDDVAAFEAENADWLPDYALYEALRGEDPRAWWEWPAAIAGRDPGALAAARARLAGEMRYQVFGQWLFARQWQSVRNHAGQRGVRIVGDIPIFVARDSADTWANRGIFKLDGEGLPEVVAGVPPDAFSATGQLWGNPLYDWEVLRADGYGWWTRRLEKTLEMVDLVRLDHFRGFVAAWEVPYAEETAVRGRWAPGPGREVFAALEARLGRLPIVVEDLGVITADVRQLRDELGYPGMKVLQFAFGDDARNPYLPHNIEANALIYTGTHDNDTTASWAASLPGWQRQRVLAYTGGADAGDIVTGLIRAAYASVAKMAMVPMQDVLRLGNEARMNVPGVAGGNWSWRFRWSQVHHDHGAFLRECAELYGRAH
ncbi:MAG: 4-alpha-glucanotransferase [Chloroflexi bacterium]|nr:4-alpha-glucanotransferase [Chloroflexota bacterium]